MFSENKRVFLRLFCDLRIFRAKIVNVRIFGEFLGVGRFGMKMS